MIGMRMHEKKFTKKISWGKERFYIKGGSLVEKKHNKTPRCSEVEGKNNGVSNGLLRHTYSAILITVFNLPFSNLS